jgi:type II secretory pathway component PulJ
MSRRGGFTLLETRMALAVTAVVLSALYGAVGRAALARGQATDAAERVATARTFLLRLASELEAATTLAERGGDEAFVVTPAPPGGAPWSALRFATRDARRAGTDEVRLVSYRMEPTGELRRRDTLRFPPPDAPEPGGVAVLDGVRVFRVRCFDGDTWRGEWRIPRLPRAVEIAVGVDDDAELVTRIALPTQGDT